MCATHESSPTRFAAAAPKTMLRAGCAIALLASLSACGGSGETAPPPTVPDTAPSSPPPMAPPPVVVGTAVSVDSGASGNPVRLRVKRSANGDGFAIWLADDGTRHNVWANRYHAATAAWGNAINIETSDNDIDHFDVAVDASGNAMAVWNEPSADRRSGVVKSARFDTGAGAWAAPVQLSVVQGLSRPLVASDATGAVLAVYGTGNGRFFDPATGEWLPEDRIEQSSFTTGFNFGPVPLLDGRGNAMVAYQNARTSAGILAGNYFSRSTGSWGRLPPDRMEDILYMVPGSLIFGFHSNLQLATTTDGNFLLAWQATFDTVPESSAIGISRFTTSTRTWSAAQIVIPSNASNDVRFQRLASDGGGNAHLVWTESEGMRTALKGVRLDPTGTACSPIQVIDRAVGGGAAQADIGVDPGGRAIAIWRQFEGGRVDDGSRSNVAINLFDAASGGWASAVLAEMLPGNAISPSASAAGGVALVGWIQSEGESGRVRVLLQPLMPGG